MLFVRERCGGFDKMANCIGVTYKCEGPSSKMRGNYAIEDFVF